MSMDSLDSAQRADIRAQLDRLLVSPGFATSLRRGQLLRYLVERVLASEEINEYSIGLDVFDKPPSFDPRIESIVRTETGRLRRKLKEYYTGQGRTDKVQIEIPLRSYKPVFTFREPAAVAATTRKPFHPAILVSGLALSLIAGAFVARQWHPRPQPIRSLVVVPFRNLSPDKSEEYLSDGITDELTNEFASWKELRVAARTSAYLYKGKGVDVRKIGQELNVDAVMEGSLFRQDSHLRVTVQLNRASDGYNLWSQSYDARSPDLLTLQREIALATASAMRDLVGKIQNPIRRPSTNNPEALDLYLQASYQYARLEPASIEKSINLFHQAIEKDPGYARAYLGLAQAELELTNFQAPEKGRVRARKALLEALRLDPDSGDVHGLLADLAAYIDNDWPRAEREFQLAIQKGAQPSTHAAYGWCLARRCRFSEAQDQCTAAQNLEPLGVAPRFCQFYVYFFQRQYSQARKKLLEALDLNPNLIYAHSQLALVAILEKDCPEAARRFEWSAPKLPESAVTMSLAYESACRGETERARRYLTKAAGLSTPAPNFELARGYALIRDSDAAITYLQKAAATGEPVALLLREPFFDKLRSDARYVALERVARLEP
ncbi:MAG: hypothetical protein C5B51_02785 [Terriglobia bacterium]|nr:MAG: hypothetical protein C5B51_02785 [Terriglobia bacterium]